MPSSNSVIEVQTHVDSHTCLSVIPGSSQRLLLPCRLGTANLHNLDAAGGGRRVCIQPSEKVTAQQNHAEPYRHCAGELPTSMLVELSSCS